MQHCSKFVMRFTSRPSRQRLMNHSYWNHSVLISKIQRLNEHLENPCLQSAAGIDDRARHRLLSFSLSLPPSLPPLPPPPSTPLFLSFSLWFHWTIYCVHCSCCIINITKLQFHFFPTRSGYGLRVALAAHARPLVCVCVCVCFSFRMLMACRKANISMQLQNPRQQQQRQLNVFKKIFQLPPPTTSIQKIYLYMYIYIW